MGSTASCSQYAQLQIHNFACRLARGMPEGCWRPARLGGGAVGGSPIVHGGGAGAHGRGELAAWGQVGAGVHGVAGAAGGGPGQSQS